MITIKDIAEKCNVSTATVSNVLSGKEKSSEETKKRILAAAKELGYRPQRVHRGSHGTSRKCIGILAEELTTDFSLNMLNGISHACQELGFNMQLFNICFTDYQIPNFDYISFQNSDSYQSLLEKGIHTFLQNNVSGIIFMGAHPRSMKGLLPDLPVPIAYAFCYTDSTDYCLNSDDYQGAQLALQHLINLGHRRIAIVCGPINSVPTHRRLSGYQDTLLQNGLTLYPDYILSGDWSMESGAAAAERIFLMKERPSAVFCMSDEMAAGLMHYMSNNHFLIPEDLSVIGFDGREMVRYCQPSLCSIRQPFTQMGYQAVLAIHKQISKTLSTDDNSILLPCHLIPGKSVGPAVNSTISN
ncbi:MAG: LacI family DNA-binding transcriptional regulator [Eubacteriales bacterium]|nr:LacI family DNA-binding transcriptional regulator [Eubacteriales bacterium]